jgi:hypothetical protein
MPEKQHIRLTRIGNHFYHTFGGLVIGYVGPVGHCLRP